MTAALLVCPGCRTASEGRIDLRTLDRAGDVLVCECGRRYPIVDDLPIVMADAGGFIRNEIATILERDLAPSLAQALVENQPDDAPYARNGVYAVRVGPVLAHNVRRAAGGGELKPYQPQTRALNLLALGDGRAIASWGGWAAQGRLMGWWKDRIDRAFIARWRIGA